MKGIAQLLEIHAMMDRNERAVLRNYLTCFESRKKGHKPKTLILLELIEKYGSDAKTIAYFKKKVPSEDTRRMIIHRLKEKMFTTLTLDVNLSRDEHYDDQAQARATMTLGKLQGEILLGRGKRKLGFDVLNKTIKIAKEFEFYDELVSMLATQRRFVKAYTGKDSSFYDVVAEIERFSECRDAADKAKQYFEEVTMRFGFKGLSRLPADEEQVRFLESRISELKSLYESTGSATVGYYYYFLLVELRQLQNDLQEAEKALHGLAVLLNNNPAIKRRVRQASVHLNLGANALWLHEFEKAQKQFTLSLSFVRPNTRNHAVISELLFYSLFYAGALNKAEDALQRLVENKNADQSDFRKAVLNYLLACVSFAKGEFRKVNLRLANSIGIGTDKEGWNIGSRVLSIMLAIEREKYDHADSQIVNLRQFVREGVKIAEIRKRDRYILDVLLELRKKSYDFKEVANTSEETLLNLRSDNVDEGWLVQTPEIICFHTWFDDKLNGRPHILDYSKEHLFG